MVFLNVLALNPLKLPLRQDAQELPSNFKGPLNRAVLTPILGYKLFFKAIRKLEEPLVPVCKRLLTNYRNQVAEIPAFGVGGVHLVRDVCMVLPRPASADAALHQSGQAWEHVYRWINPPSMQLSREHELPFSNIAC